MNHALMAYRTALWNALIPASAVRIEPGPKGVRYLHATKGWRLVRYKRLGLA